MPRIRGVNGSPIDRHDLFEEYSLTQLIAVNQEGRLGFDNIGFYYLNNSHFAAANSDNPSINFLLRRERNAASSELSRLLEIERREAEAFFGETTIDTDNSFRDAIRNILITGSSGIAVPSTVSINNLPADMTIEKKSRLNTIELGDIVNAPNFARSMEIQKGFVEDFDHTRNNFAINFDSGHRFWYTINDDRVRILSKALKVGDKVKLAHPEDTIYYRRGLGDVTKQMVGIVTIVEHLYLSTTIDENANSETVFPTIHPGTQRLRIDWSTNGGHGGWCGFNDELELIEELSKEETEELSKEETEEMKQIAKLPLNNPEIVLKHEKLGNLKTFVSKDTANNIYGYDFYNNKILKYVDTINKNDKLCFKFEVVDKNNYREFIAYSNKSDLYKLPYGDYKRLIKAGTSTTDKKQESSKEEKKVLTKEEIQEIEKIIANTCKVRIINYNESSDLFGYKPTKKDMLGSYNKITSIDYNYYHKASNKNIPIVIINNEKLGKDLKFVLSDIEIIQPDPSLWLKSYNTPKDKTIRVNSTVKVVNDKYGSVTKGEKLKVLKIDESKYILNISPRPIPRPSRRRAEEAPSGFITEEEIPMIDPSLARFRTQSITFSSTRATSVIDRLIEADRERETSKAKSKNRSKINPNCPVWCLNEKGKEVKVKIKQIKVI